VLSRPRILPTRPRWSPERYPFRAALRAPDLAVAFRLRVAAAFFAERDRAAARAALVAAAGFLVDRRPRAPFGFLLADAAMLVSFLDVFGLTFLFVGIAGFVAARHDRLPQRCGLPNLATPIGAPGFRVHWRTWPAGCGGAARAAAGM